MKIDLAAVFAAADKLNVAPIVVVESAQKSAPAGVKYTRKGGVEEGGAYASPGAHRPSLGALDVLRAHVSALASNKLTIRRAGQIAPIVERLAAKAASGKITLDEALAKNCEFIMRELREDAQVLDAFMSLMPATQSANRGARIADLAMLFKAAKGVSFVGVETRDEKAERIEHSAKRDAVVLPDTRARDSSDLRAQIPVKIDAAKAAYLKGDDGLAILEIARAHHMSLLLGGKGFTADEAAAILEGAKALSKIDWREAERRLRLRALIREEFAKK